MRLPLYRLVSGILVFAVAQSGPAQSPVAAPVANEQTVRSHVDWFVPGLARFSCAVGLSAAREACRWIQEHTQTRTVVDPFCGVGTALAVANTLGMDAIGVELNQKRARKARGLLL